MAALWTRAVLTKGGGGGGAARVLARRGKSDQVSQAASDQVDQDNEDVLPPHARIEGRIDSFKARGFLRAIRSYTPPPQAKEKVVQIYEKVCGRKAAADSRLDDVRTKFKVLDSCAAEFGGHSVPNSQLHLVDTVAELARFYAMEVVTNSPLDSMKKMELPKNLHIQYEYQRFHPDTDTLFGGITAFPKSSTIVTGVKAKKKYRGFKAKTSWP